ncbi:MAG: molybdopterin-dependent oxidoreductase [Acidimicrobiales bacterium]|nr:molybdopterin-dependent oxidoreductase [Acidimicrobiales bacterium]
MTETHAVTCPLCEATCGLEVTTDGDQVVRIRGDMNDVFSKGFICPKGSTLKQLHEDPDRLRAPLVKRDGKFVEVGWDEAFAEIEARLQPIIDEHGRESLGMYLGNPNAHTIAGALFVRPVIMAMGSRNLFSASTVDQMPKHVTAGLMWGDPGAFPLPDLDRTDHLLILGGNPYVSNGSLVTAPDFPGRLDAIVERGKVVVVDPRTSKTAQKATEHHTIVPGTDIYLLLAMINECFAAGLAEVGRLEPHVAGLDWVSEAVASFTPEAVEGRCGIDAATIRRMTQEFAAAPSAAAYGRMGAHTVEFGTLTSWATDVLNAITGNLDRAGGIMFAGPPWERFDPQRTPGGRGYQTGRWHSRAKGLPEANGEFPSVTLADEIETPGPGQLRAMFLIAGNPVRSYPNSERLDAAFASLDFMVAVDIYVTESSQHADVILPGRSALERSQFDFAFYSNAIRRVVNYTPPTFETDQPDETEVLARLANVVGGFGADADPALVFDSMVEFTIDREVTNESSPIFGRNKDEIRGAVAHWPPAERIIDLRLQTGDFGAGFGADPDGLSLQKLIDNPHGLDFGPLIEKFPAAIKTASGQVELAPEPIVADFERLRASFATDPAASDLVLVGRRHLRSNNSWMHNVKVLVKGKDRCTLQVHPDDAARLGLADGARASVSSRVGTVEAPVEVTADVRPGVVSLPHGWGHDAPGARLSVAAEHAGVNSNALTDDAVYDHLSGNAVLNAIPVEVAPV